MSMRDLVEVKKHQGFKERKKVRKKKLFTQESLHAILLSLHCKRDKKKNA